MIRYIFLIFTVLLLNGCEETDLSLITEAASDAVTAATLSDEDVRKLAQRASLVADDNHKIAPSGSSYDIRLKKLISRYAARDGHTFNYKVYLTKQVNAFAMADGSIRVNSALMDLMTDEELLFVLGHEIGHVVKQHSKKKVILAYASSALRKGLASQENEIGQIARSVIGSLAERLANAQFSQHEEREADQYAVQFLQSEGYSTQAAVSALEKLAELARRHTFLSSHPDPEERAKTVLLEKKNDTKEQSSFFQQLFQAAGNILKILLGLAHSLLTWLLSFI